MKKVLVSVLVVVAVAGAPLAARSDDPPGWPLAACAIDPDGEPVHCRCLFSVPQGLPVDDPAECPEPASTTVVDCWLPSGEPCSSATSTTSYTPTPADVNDLPIEPAPAVDLEPRFTG